VRTIHWPKVIASTWPLSIISADHRAFLLTVCNRPWTQIRRADPPDWRLLVDDAGLAGMAVSQVVALRGPGELAL